MWATSFNENEKQVRSNNDASEGRDEFKTAERCLPGCLLQVVCRLFAFLLVTGQYPTVSWLSQPFSFDFVVKKKTRDGWTHRQMDGRTDGWMDGRMDGWTDGRMDGQMDGRTDGRMDGWTDRRMDGQTDRWTDRK